MTAVVGTVRRHVALLGLALAVPLVVALLSASRPRWYPAGDFAQAELHVRAVPRHMPLVGAAARVGTILDQGSHPGPAGAVSLAVPYRLLGSQSWSLMAATIVVHLVAMTFAVVVARRVGGTLAAALVAVACAVMIRALGPSWFLEPWNPWLGVFVLLLTIVLTWAVWSGSTSWLPVLVLSASFCVQVHLGYGVIVAGFGLTVAGRLLVLSRRTEPPPLRRPLLLAGAVAAITWLPVVVDEVTREPGNITRLWRHFTDPPEASAGLRAALTAFVNEFNLLGTWSLGRDRQPTESLDLIALIGFVAMVALCTLAVWVAVRRRDRQAVDALTVCGITVGLTLLTLVRIFGPIYDYIIRWTVVVAASCVVVSVWTLVRAYRPAPRHVATMAAVVGAACLAAATVSALDAEQPLAVDGEITGALAREAVPALDPALTHLVRLHDPVSLGAPAIGMVLEMERQGLDVGTDAWLSANVMPHRILDEEDADDVVWVVTGDPAIADALAEPGARLLARVDMRTDDERAESDRLRTEIETQLVDIGRADLVERLDEQYGVSQVEAEPGLPDDLVSLVATYRALRLPAAVVLVPRSAP